MLDPTVAKHWQNKAKGAPKIGKLCSVTLKSLKMIFPIDFAISFSIFATGISNCDETRTVRRGQSYFPHSVRNPYNTDDFSEIITKYIPQLVREGEKWNAFGECGI